MKKIFLIAVVACSSVGIISAQDDCMALFPTTEGATMTSKSYDGNNNLITTTTYTVGEIQDNYYSGSAQISFQSVDPMGNIVDQGSLETRCDDGNFYLKSLNRMMFPESQGLLLENIELMGNFLDYPNTFSSPYPFDNTFEMDGAEFTIKSKDKDGEFVRVRVYNRDYEKNEDVTTPAGKFDAAKISYMVEVYDSATKESKEYKGIEWYALESGIVRSELYDRDNNLQAYSVVTDMSN